jgi:hypothetical protein
MHPQPPKVGALASKMALSTLVAVTLVNTNGLGSVAIAAVVAVMIAAPVAIHEWRADRPVHAATSALGEAILLGWLASVLATSTRPIQAMLVWLTAWAVARFLGGTFVALIALAVSVTTLSGAIALSDAPWTFLSPRWSPLDGNALTGGLLLASLGMGWWSQSAPPRPGEGRGPFLVVAVGLWTAIWAVVATGSAYETMVGGHQLAIVSRSLLVLVGVVAAMNLRGATRTSTPLVGIAFTMWLMAIGDVASQFFILVLLPAALTLVLAHQAYRSRYPPMAAAAAVGAIGTWLAWPGLPHHPRQAALVALTAVAMLWYAGFRGQEAR